MLVFRIFCVVMLFFTRSNLYADDSVLNEVIIKYKDSVRALRSLTSSGLLNGITDMPEYITDNTYLIKTDSSVDEVINQLKDDEAIEFIQPNYIYKALIIPNDPILLDNSSNYQFQKEVGVNAINGWDIKTDASSILVGVLDSGISITHIDLFRNIENNGVDTLPPVQLEGLNIGFDDNGHGTHVSGIIGAMCDNSLGSCGVAWRVRLLPLKVLNSNGVGTSTGIIKAIDYAVSKGVRVLNASLGGDVNQFPYLEYLALKRATDRGVVVVAAAGNAARGKLPYNTDISPAFPAAFGLRGIISVGASNKDAAAAAFSYYGTTSVHLFAPGVNIYSTYLNNEFGKESGTSMSAPFVTGVVSLLLASDFTLTSSEVEMIIVNSTDKSEALRGLSMTGGVINLEKALKFDKSKLFSPPYNLTLAHQEDNNNIINLKWQGGSGETEIYSRTDKGAFNLIATVDDGIKSYIDKVDLEGSSHRYKYYRIRSVKDGVYSPFLRKELALSSGLPDNEYIVAGAIPEIKTRITENGNGGCSISKSSDFVMVAILILIALKSVIILRKKLSQ